MKRIPTVIKLTVLIISIFSLAYSYYELGLFTKYNSRTATYDIKRGDIRILIYGELDDNEAAKNKIAKIFGFRFERVEDCTVTQPFINGIEKYNNTVKHYLEERYGANWEESFNKKLLEEIK